MGTKSAIFKRISIKFLIFLMLFSTISATATTPHIMADTGLKGENFKNFITNYEFLENGILVKAAANGALWASKFATNLMKSTDYGLNWISLYEFEKPITAIFCDDYDNIFVSITMDRWASQGTGELHKSSDGGITFYKILDIKSGAVFDWNIDSKNGMMIVSEYGYKGADNNARRIYRSFDYGDNWEIVYEPKATLEYHNHKTLISDNNTIYQSVGDGSNAKIMKSLDKGDNWRSIIKAYHPTSAVEFENHILWGLDAGPVSGIALFNKKTEKIEYTFSVPYPFNGSCYDMEEANGVVYAVFMSYGGASHPGSIFYSEDEGRTWNLLGYIEKDPADGVGLYSLTVDENYGYIDFQGPVYSGDSVEYYRGTLRFELLRKQDRQADKAEMKYSKSYIE